MSTKTSLKVGKDPENGASFHLYTDWLDECGGHDLVNLHLDGVPFEAEATKDRRTATLKIPRALAAQLGLIPPTSQAA